MYNLYQSNLRKDIQTKIYNKPHFTINLFGKDYFGLVKEKNIGPFKTKWLQIMGVEFPTDKDYIKSELKKLAQKYKKEKGVIFVQLCLLNEIIRFENVGIRSDSFLNDMKEIRLQVRQQMKELYGLETAFRENMPQANIVYDITKSDEELMSEMNSGCKERVKKAIKKGIEFGVASPDQYDLFYQKWIELSGMKGFNIIPKEQYHKLIRYMTQNNRGNLFTSTINGDIIAGSICVYDQHRIIYLYGFSNRKYSNIGGHHYLKFKIFGHARKLGMTYVDMLGGAPTGFPTHPLNGVSRFKESLGGTKIEQYGSYDLIIRPRLYKLFKFYFKLKNRE
ncbi:MAG TPA: peptidoglycan bridge formation glycyltransferase FemA/FemB family protein [Candidatus Absconditabacterales bacterium]|nr:peptidoglycan bridge formation glycyltransferase FemA/FemB family protein [Candidatus Absconditabacterales bacterium]HOQ78855.1 peptidoglycan bridge formation glycyltransferase FemA/FemB family protein [Candidatus Absconditabacterales bacterium]